MSSGFIVVAVLKNKSQINANANCTNTEPMKYLCAAGKSGRKTEKMEKKRYNIYIVKFIQLRDTNKIQINSLFKLFLLKVLSLTWILDHKIIFVLLVEPEGWSHADVVCKLCSPVTNQLCSKLDDSEYYFSSNWRRCRQCRHSPHQFDFISSPWVKQMLHMHTIENILGDLTIGLVHVNKSFTLNVKAERIFISLSSIVYILRKIRCNQFHSFLIFI